MTDLLRVAQLAGVSRATAARTFSEPEKVRESTRNKVVAASKALGFRPNYVARQLRTQSTRIIGVMLPTLSNPIFSEQLQAMESSARNNGYSLMVATTDYDPARESVVLENMLRQRIDGLILTVANARESRCLSMLEQETLPVVLVHNPDADAHFVTVSVDNKRAMYQATCHLLALGHRQIAMTAGPVQQSDRAHLRYLGYCQAMEENGLTPLPLIEMAHHTCVDIETLRPWLSTPTVLTALLCSNDLLALSAIGSLQRIGYRIPQQLSVVGFDGIALGRMVCPSLCSVEQPQQQLGEVAIESLMKSIAGEEVTSQVLNFTLRDGESIAVPQHLCRHTRETP
ncbi:GntR family transcriptional regulator [[Pantoea] beijingensis]|uniref:GntR family transcriptional regulator n=1 Tax=[Pantoea] beijingensis TaxID=1324864 RepID=A0A443IAD9_9GAMM|nr:MULTISPECIES: substrate-binding domain-containing protein [Erwiniaceae]RWR00950.1 GntR family transcriptional regulator [[Pantoea] beijingensis]